MDGGGHDRTFKDSFAKFSADGVAKLRERVMEKLREFLGDYTDYTLVEYVTMLLRNGRHKDEAVRELRVFLNDDSTAFISWLWNHLSSNSQLYIQPQVDATTNVAKSSNALRETSGEHKSSQAHLTDKTQIDPEPERVESNASRIWHKRARKGLGQEEAGIFPLQSVVTDILHTEDKHDHKPNTARQSRPSHSRDHRKRGRGEEQQSTKRDSSLHRVVDAPRRLLQFAVRDAVRTMQKTGSVSEPASKRLRSVVSTSTTDHPVRDKRQQSRSILNAPGAAIALKAIAEAAEDVTKAGSSANVFNRLGNGRRTMDNVSPSLDVREQSVDKETQMAADSASDNDGYGAIGIIGHCSLDPNQSAVASSTEKNSLMVEYSVAPEAEVVRKMRLIDQDSPPASSSMTSSKIVNISVNVNTWKPQNYQMPRDVSVVEKTDGNPGRSNARKPNENDSAVADGIKGLMQVDAPKDSQKASSTPVIGSFSAVHPPHDVDSRTLFVSNVHFAATKDALSRHFNKFGAVLKVVIVTDAATGQPSGSAYVEFLHKESVELALSLNGTSFMSRLLKVVKRSTHKAPQFLGWPRIARPSPFASRLGGRLSYPRGILPGSFRGRLPIKAGARSLQWTRGASTTQSTAGPPRAQVVSPTARSLTYTRTESKADGCSGQA